MEEYVIKFLLKNIALEATDTKVCLGLAVMRQAVPSENAISVDIVAGK